MARDFWLQGFDSQSLDGPSFVLGRPLQSSQIDPRRADMLETLLKSVTEQCSGIIDEDPFAEEVSIASGA